MSSVENFHFYLQKRRNTKFVILVESIISLKTLRENEHLADKHTVKERS